MKFFSGELGTRPANVLATRNLQVVFDFVGHLVAVFAGSFASEAVLVEECR